MRSTGAIIAGLLVIGLVTNCGGNDSTGPGPKASGGEGGAGNTSGGTGNVAGSITVGGEGGRPPVVVGCTRDADCGATATCVSAVCKLNDGQKCTASGDCANTCIDKVCTSALADGKDCTVDADCAHTCIDNVCKPISAVGGDCDVAFGAGGASGVGGDGAGGAGGDSSSAPQNPDCVAPLQCVSGQCLTPDGEACNDNVDCVSTCIASVCAPTSGLNQPCDATDDCVPAGDKFQLTCDLNKKVCKLKTTSQCTDNSQCATNKCLCSNKTCTVRTCKTEDSACQCRYSPEDSASCSTDSSVLDTGSQDPNGCGAATNKICKEGGCISNEGGKCTQDCIQKDTKGTPDDESDDACVSSASPKGCNTGYNATMTQECTLQKISFYPAAADYACGYTCACNR